jgi:hypothetical protein
LKWQWWQASEVGLWFMKYSRLWFEYFCCLLRYFLVHSYSQLVKFNWFEDTRRRVAPELVSWPQSVLILCRANLIFEFCVELRQEKKLDL